MSRQEDSDDRSENESPPYNSSEAFDAWSAIHNDADYDPKTDSEPGYPDYQGDDRRED